MQRELLFIFISGVVFKICKISQEIKTLAFWNLVSNQVLPDMSVKRSDFFIFKSSFSKCVLLKTCPEKFRSFCWSLFSILYIKKRFRYRIFSVHLVKFFRFCRTRTSSVPRAYFRYERKIKNLKLFWGQGWQNTSRRVILHLAKINSQEILKTVLSWVSAFAHLPNVSLYLRNSE